MCCLPHASGRLARAGSLIVATRRIASMYMFRRASRRPFRKASKQPTMSSIIIPGFSLGITACSVSHRLNLSSHPHQRPGAVSLPDVPYCIADPTGQLARMQLDRSHPKQTYKFWETQPVAQFADAKEGPADAKEGPIHELKTPQDARQEPYPLNEQFEWCLCDLQDEAVITEVFDLLRLNYVEDEDQMFRFCYSKDFLRWALCPPGHKKEWHLGVRVIANRKLVCCSCMY